jgi:uncharacterized protein involved in exopolysaccharide biosynthesis
MVFENSRLTLSTVDTLREKLGTLSWRRFLLSAGIVVSVTTCGVVLPGMLLDPGLKGYVSHASVEIDGLRETRSDARRIAAHLRENLLSPVGLSLAVSDLNLQAKDLTGIQEQGHIGVLIDLLAGGGEKTNGLVGATENALKEAVSISSSASGDTINVDLTTASPESAQRIADYLSTRAINEIGGERQEPALRAIDNARTALDGAEAALTGFQMRYGDDAVSRMQGLQLRIRDADAAALELEHKNAQLTEAIAVGSPMKTDDILNNSLTEIAYFAPLEAIRQNYTNAKLALAEVSVDHGPKHPRAIAAQGVVDAARAAVMPAMRRVLEALKREQATVAAALETQTQARSALNEQLQAMGDAPADLARLEAGLEKARRDYLTASEVAGTFATAPRLTASLVTKAEAGLPRYDGFTANAMAIAGGAAGLLLSLFMLSFRRQEYEVETSTQLSDVVKPEAPLVDDAVDEAAFAELVEIEPAIFDDLDNGDVGAEQSEGKDVEIASFAVSENEPETETPHDEPANDIPLDQRVRQVLMRNMARLDRDESEPPVFRLPPLLEAALAGQAVHTQAETEELKALRQELVLLRERLSDHAAFEEEYRSQA